MDQNLSPTQALLGLESNLAHGNMEEGTRTSPLWRKTANTLLVCRTLFFGKSSRAARRGPIGFFPLIGEDLDSYTIYKEGGRQLGLILSLFKKGKKKRRGHFCFDWSLISVLEASIARVISQLQSCVISSPWPLSLLWSFTPSSGAWVEGFATSRCPSFIPRWDSQLLASPRWQFVPRISLILHFIFIIVLLILFW